MERLPHEVKSKIFEALSFCDKFNCLLVSKDWNKFVKPCLYKDIAVRNSGTLTNAMIFFEKYRELAKHVRHLDISDCSNIFLHLPRLQQLFPDLKRLFWKITDSVFWYRTPPQRCTTIGIWRKLKEIHTVESIDGDEPFIAEWILSNYCPGVAELSMCLFESERSEALQERFLNVFMLMKNAPQLTKLVTNYIYCSMNDLEILHHNTPNLKSLTLSNITFSTVSTSSPKPTSLSELKIQYGMVDREEVLLQGPIILSLINYIARKYIGLSALAITAKLTYLNLNLIDPIQTEQRILPLFSQCPRLSNYNVMLCPLTNSLLQEMDRCGIQLHYIKLYLTRNTVNNQCLALVGSNQLGSITRLSIVTICNVGLEELSREETTEMKALEILNQMNNLTSVTLESHVLPICLTVLLFYVNQMTRLTHISLKNTCSVPLNTLPSVSSTLKLRTIEISSLEIYSLEELDAANKVLSALISNSPDLEHFKLQIDVKSHYLSATAEATQRTGPYTLTLDFKTRSKLKSIEVHPECLFYIIRDSPRICTFDKEKCQFIERDFILPHEYYTTVLLAKPTLFNSAMT